MLRSFNPKRQAERARRVAELRIAEKAGRRAALIASPGRLASMGPAELETAPKDVPDRNPALLALAKGAPCLLFAVPECRNVNLRRDHSTTVACHQNEGKGMASKRPDQYSVWGCAECHTWLDRSGAPREDKRRVFMEAHVRQVGIWRLIAADSSLKPHIRAAAQWALDRLNATPVIDLETAP